MTRGTRRLLFAACFLAGLVIPPLLSSVHQLWPVRHEVQRIASPDKSIDAVSATIQTGIITHQLWYEVYLVKHGGPFKSAKPVFSALKIENAELTWTAPRLLEISYARARIEEYKNHWGGAADQPESIEIRLIPSSPGFSYLSSFGTVENDRKP